MEKTHWSNNKLNEIQWNDSRSNIKKNKIKQFWMFVPYAGILSYQFWVKINIMFKNCYAWENKNYLKLQALL